MDCFLLMSVLGLNKQMFERGALYGKQSYFISKKIHDRYAEVGNFDRCC